MFDKKVIARNPPDIFEFLAMEERQVLVSIHKMPEEMRAVGHLDGLYKAAMEWKTVREDDYVIFQLLTFTHYHFLFALASQMRCHLSEAFASARVAMDATLIAAYIIKDRSAQVAYAKREKPFDNFARHLGNMRAQRQPLPHPLMEVLIDQQKKISQFAAHADVGSFVHRVRQTEKDGQQLIGIEYFQFARDDNERKLHTFSLLHTFVMVLDVFADFLVAEQDVVPLAWKEQVHSVGAGIERRVSNLSDLVLAAYGETQSDSDLGALPIS